MWRTQTGDTSADAPAGGTPGSSVAAVVDAQDGVAAAPHALAASPAGRPESRWLRHLAASGVTMALLALSATALGVARRLPTGLALGDVVWAAAWTLYAVVGGFLALRCPRHPVGWLFLAAGVLVPVASLLDAGAMLLAADGHAEVAGLLHTASEAMWIPALVLGLPLALAHFPDGRPLSPRWAWGVHAGWAAAALSVVTALLPAAPLDPVVPALVLVSAGSAVASLAVRWRRADSVERRQLLWLAFAVLVLAALHGLVGAYLLAGGSLSPLGGSLLAAAAVTLLPVGATVAVVRHGLLDIELVVRRSVALVLLVSAVTVAYLGVFVALGALGSTRPAASLLATVAAACVAVPTHARARAAVDRRLFGHRDPYRVLAELGAELQRGRGSRPALDAMLAATRLAVRSPGAAVVTESGRRLGVDGQLPDPDAASLSLLHHGAGVGTLLVAPRSAGEPFSERDRGMLADLAPHLAAAAAVVRLTDDVQHAREQLVLAREEERRRLRRDLHDGVGPTLAAISMRVALEREEATDAPAARLAQVQDLVDAAVVEVRRLVDGLRPPALDDLGVVAAARERASELGLEVEWRIGDLPEMTAAAESAVYRIAGEALTNVARHAAIRCCRVELGRHGAGVLLVVRDRGRGLSGAPPGTGRSSMRERAEELGGWCRVREADGGGTEIVTWLPT